MWRWPVDSPLEPRLIAVWQDKCQKGRASVMSVMSRPEFLPYRRRDSNPHALWHSLKFSIL